MSFPETGLTAPPSFFTTQLGTLLSQLLSSEGSELPEASAKVVLHGPLSSVSTMASGSVDFH